MRGVAEQCDAAERPARQWIVGSVLMPTPSSWIRWDCSNFSQSMPRACSIRALVSTPIPPRRSGLSWALIVPGPFRRATEKRACRRPPGKSGLFRLDAGFANDLAPAPGLFLDKNADLH